MKFSITGINVFREFSSNSHNYDIARDRRAKAAHINLKIIIFCFILEKRPTWSPNICKTQRIISKPNRYTDSKHMNAFGYLRNRTRVNVWGTVNAHIGSAAWGERRRRSRRTGGDEAAGTSSTALLSQPRRRRRLRRRRFHPGWPSGSRMWVNRVSSAQPPWSWCSSFRRHRSSSNRDPWTRFDRCILGKKMNRRMTWCMLLYQGVVWCEQLSVLRYIALPNFKKIPCKFPNLALS